MDNCNFVVKLNEILTKKFLCRIRFSKTETGFSLVSTVLCILLCETKTGFRNHGNHPRTWFRWFRC